MSPSASVVPWTAGVPRQTQILRHTPVEGERPAVIPRTYVIGVTVRTSYDVPHTTLDVAAAYVGGVRPHELREVSNLALRIWCHPPTFRVVLREPI